MSKTAVYLTAVVVTIAGLCSATTFSNFNSGSSGYPEGRAIESPSFKFSYGENHDGSGGVHQYYKGPDSAFIYNWGYQFPGRSHSETKRRDGVVQGEYSFVDPEGKIQQARYRSSPGAGFTVDQSVVGVARSPFPAAAPVAAPAAPFRQPILAPVAPFRQPVPAPVAPFRQPVPTPVAPFRQPIPEPVVQFRQPVSAPVAPFQPAFASVVPFQQTFPHAPQLDFLIRSEGDYTQNLYRSLAGQEIGLDIGSKQAIERASSALLSSVRAGLLEPLRGNQDELVFKVSDALVNEARGSVSTLASVLDADPVAARHDQQVVRGSAFIYSTQQQDDNSERAVLETEIHSDGKPIYVIRVPYPRP